MAVIVGSVAAFEVWWLAQPPIDQPSVQLDINTATIRELATLPGIDQSTADKVARERPYNRQDDLVTKNIVTRPTYDTIKDKIVVNRSGGE